MPNPQPAPVKDGTDPEIPDAVIRRPKTALTTHAAEEIRKETGRDVDVLTEEGRLSRNKPVVKKPLKKGKRSAVPASFKPKAFPLQGLTPDQINEIRGKSYPGAPKMDGSLGDLTPAFMEWLWANHPEDAEVRYAYRVQRPQP